MNVEKEFKKNLPRALFCSDGRQRSLFGESFRVQFTRVEEAIKSLLVQYNAKNNVKWLAYDLDLPNSGIHWQDRNAPPPNIVAVNRENGHAHLFYGLEIAVHRNQDSSGRALRYLAAVDVALTAKLDADPAYAKFLAKNPLRSDHWIVITPRQDLYDLSELSDWLDLKPYSDRRKRLPAVGEGRNCTLFEALRRFAYTERRREDRYLNYDFFRHAVLSRALAINSGFNPPLPHSEVRATAKSIARWTWEKMSEEGFREWQRRKSAAGNRQKRRQAEKRKAAIIETWRNCHDLTQSEIAALCGCSLRTVSKVLWENF
jgi:hypothetical protein